MNDTVSFGYEDIDASEKTGRVGQVFSNVAAKYDIMNDAMSGGMHRLWKDRFVKRVKPQPGEQILDMAGGTGDIAFRMAAKGASVTVSDINQDMLDVGIERTMERGIDGLVWSRQNAEELAFSSRTFDAYTIVFGIRNVTFIDKALREAHRVLARVEALDRPHARTTGHRCLPGGDGVPAQRRHATHAAHHHPAPRFFGPRSHPCVRSLT